MADDFLSTFMGSSGRAKVLRVFLFDQAQSFTLAQVGKRSGIAVQAAAKEIKVLEQWDVLKRGKFEIAVKGTNARVVADKQKHPTWTLNPAFKHLRSLSMFVHEVSPMNHDRILGALKSSGKISTVIISGTFMGDVTRPADLIIAGDALNENRLESAIHALEAHCGREIRYASFSRPEFQYRLTIQDRLIRDTLDYPHLVLLDKTKLL